jgi:hypothetical protein
VAIPGVWPLLFPRPGYKGQLNWLADVAACLGKDADSALLAAAKEGPLHLPTHLTVRLLDGQVVFLGPHLTTPSEEHLKAWPDLMLSSCVGEEVVVTHRTLEKDCEEEEGEKEEEVDSKDDEDGSEAGDQEFKPVEKPDRDAEQKEEEWVKEETKKNRKVAVMFDAKNVTAEELSSHFSKYGEVEEVYLLPPFYNYAAVTYVSEATAEFVRAKTGRRGKEGERLHVLQRPAALGGQLQMRLPQAGGSGRPGAGQAGGRLAPPTLQRQAANVFR